MRYGEQGRLIDPVKQGRGTYEPDVTRERHEYLEQDSKASTMSTRELAVRKQEARRAQEQPSHVYTTR